MIPRAIDVSTRWSRWAQVRGWVLLGAWLAMALVGCNGDSEPAQVFEIPEDASPEEVTPGEPLPPPEYQESSGLPGPPPQNPYDATRGN